MGLGLVAFPPETEFHGVPGRRLGYRGKELSFLHADCRCLDQFFMGNTGVQKWGVESAGKWVQ